MFKTKGMVSITTTDLHSMWWSSVITTHWHKSNDSNTGRGVAATNNTRHYYIGIVAQKSTWNAQTTMYTISWLYRALNDSQIRRPNNVSKYQCSLNTWNKAISERGCSLLMQSQSEDQFALLAKESTYFNRKEAPSMLPERALCVTMETYLFSMSLSTHYEVIDNLQSADWIFVILTYGTWMSIIYLSLSSFYLISLRLRK